MVWNLFQANVRRRMRTATRIRGLASEAAMAANGTLADGGSIEVENATAIEGAVTGDASVADGASVAGGTSIAGEDAGEDSTNQPVVPVDALKVRLDLLAEQYGLTPREAEVALLTVQGFSGAYISEKLFVSNSTVRFHQQNIYRKFDVHSRNELIEAVTA